MATLTQAFDELCGRLLRLRSKRTYTDLAKEIGISSPTLHKFLRRDDCSDQAKRLIEQWCNQEEARTETKQDGQHE